MIRFIRRFKRLLLDDAWITIRRIAIKTANISLFALSTIAFMVIIYDFGFKHSPLVDKAMNGFYAFCLLFFFIGSGLRILLLLSRKGVQKPHFTDYILIGFLLASVWVRFTFPELVQTTTPFLGFPVRIFFLHLPLMVVFFIELSKNSLHVGKLNMNPALLFIISFGFIILIGTGLLLLPLATTNGISIIDAFFTSTSAVCVTGLIVVDTASAFTHFGKTIILILIQLGGLGIMTFTSFFGFFFKGSSSFKNQLLLQDYVNTDRMGEVFYTLFKIIFLTLSIEATGAILIFFSLDADLFANLGDHIEFSVFHAISAFCNAGFSTLTNGLYDINIRFNYAMQLSICYLIIIGGLGFPIIFNYYKYLKLNTKARLNQWLKNEKFIYTPRIINVNSFIVVLSTFVLLLAGTSLYFIAEFNNTLTEHTTWIGKFIASFFGAVTPRTAGFNTVDMNALRPATILIYLLLMWIGASPGSTGGGIKTTTFAIAVLNTINTARGKQRLEIRRREISNDSVKRAFAIILLSFLVIGLAVLLLTLFEPEKELAAVAFESFSAYSTVGLSLGITPQLTDPGKIVIIFTMFLGRVGTLTLIIALINKVVYQNYRYPKENIFIN